MSKKKVVIITNTETHHSAHNIVYLGLPPGFTYNFRYRKKYLSRIQRATDSIWVTSLLKREGYLVLRDKASGSFIPLRQFQISSASDSGEYVFFDLKFSGYAKFEVPDRSGIDDPAASVLRQQYSDRIAPTLPENTPNDPGKPFELLVYETNHSLDDIFTLSECSDSEGLRYWSNMVFLLGSLPDFRSKCFYRIVGLRSLGSPWFAVSTANPKPTKLPSEMYGYKLTSNRNYVLEVLQEIPVGKEASKLPFVLPVESQSAFIQPLNPDLVVDGDYDLLKYSFYTVPQEQYRAHTVLRLPVVGGERRAETKPANTQQLCISIPMCIKWPFWNRLTRSWLPPIAFLLGIGIWTWAAAIAKYPLIVSKLGPLEPEHIRYVAVFLLAYSLQSWTSFVGVFKPTK